MNGLKGAKRKQARAKLMRKYHNCPYCGCVLTKENRSIDHMIPKVLLRKGANDMQNLKLCCKACNAKKGERTTVPALRSNA